MGAVSMVQNGMTAEVVALGFALGSPNSPQAAVYAYISPAPDGLETVDFGPGAMWLPDAGLVVFPWEAVRTTADPQEAVVAFADAVYDTAVSFGG